jgi:2-hydroxyisobutanoyl-CoA mutase small subunit
MADGSSAQGDEFRWSGEGRRIRVWACRSVAGDGTRSAGVRLTFKDSMNTVYSIHASEKGVGSPQERIRVIIAKVGLDGHDRGVKIVARTLRDAGMDVIYTGLHRTPDQVVEAAVQEDADVIGVSILSGAHMTVFPRIIEQLKARGADDILVVGGGVIPDEDLSKLKAIGVREIMLQDTPPEAIVAMIRRVVQERGPR